MRYLGGKELIAQKIVDFIQPVVDMCDGYIEPFVGGGSVVCRVKHDNIIASDLHEALITMYKELQNGWIPPEVVTEDMYRLLKIVNDVNDPLTAFVGFGCSFGGMYFNGYAREGMCGDRNFAKDAKNSLFKKISRQPNFKNIEFRYCDYTEYSDAKGKFIYCDPPYKNTIQYKVGDFDTIKFFEWCSTMSKYNVVVISELNAPEDFICIKEIPKRRGIKKSGNVQELVIEKLFVHKSIVDKFSFANEWIK